MAISAGELRVGLLVIESNVNYKGTTEKIISVSIKDIMNHQNLNPIPLTEDWLLRFGFEIFKLNNGAYEVNLNDFFTLRFIPKDKWREKDAFYIYSCDDDIDIIIQYVHTFQNTFFALTGQELELK